MPGLLRTAGGGVGAEYAEIAQSNSRIPSSSRVIRSAVGMRADGESIGQPDAMRGGETQTVIAIAPDAGFGPDQPDRVGELVQAAAQQAIGQVGRAARALDHLPERILDEHLDMAQAGVARDVVELERSRLDRRAVHANPVDVDLDFP